MADCICAELDDRVKNYDVQPGLQEVRDQVGHWPSCPRFITARRATMPDPKSFVALEDASFQQWLAARLGEEDAAAAMKWWRGDDQGISSLCIWHVMTGVPRGRGSVDAPHDPSDFGRCRRLLDLIPAWRERLTEVAEAHPNTAWPEMVKDWGTFDTLWDAESTNEDGMAPLLFRAMRRSRDEFYARDQAARAGR